MMRPAIKGLLLVPDHTCFTPVAGMPLLHRALLAGHKAGIQEWLILTWHHVHNVHASLAAKARLQDLSWQTYDMQKTTSTALRDALQAAEVLVISCTAVFDRRVLLQVQHEEGTVLCVTASKVAMTGTTVQAVALHEGRLTAAPSTSRPALYATGILRCPGDLLTRILDEKWDVMQNASAPISVVLHGLMDTTQVKAVDLGQYPWVPLSSPLEASAAEAETRLIRTLGREGDSPLVRLIDRRLSQTLTKRLVRTKVTPNHITLLSALIGMSGVVFLAQPLHLWQVLGSLLFLFSTITDGCDGELARLTFQESDFGAKLDLMMDAVVHLFLFPCIALGLYRQDQQTLYLLLGALTLGGVLVSMVMYMPYLWRPPATRPANLRLHESLASRDFAYILPVLAWFGKLNWFLWAATIGTYLFALALGGIYLYQRWHQWTLAKTQ